jgi:hypothetical protein
VNDKEAVESSAVLASISPSHIAHSLNALDEEEPPQMNADLLQQIGSDREERGPGTNNWTQAALLFCLGRENERLIVDVLIREFMDARHSVKLLQRWHGGSREFY